MIACLGVGLAVACKSSPEEEAVEDAGPGCTTLCTDARFPAGVADVTPDVITCFCRGQTEPPPNDAQPAPAITSEGCSQLCADLGKENANAFSSTSTAKDTCRCT